MTDTQKHSPVVSDAEQQLLPCPFCGQTDLVMSTPAGDGSWQYVLCNECAARGPSIHLGQAAIRNDWNTRAAPSPSPAASADTLDACALVPQDGGGDR